MKPNVRTCLTLCTVVLFPGAALADPGDVTAHTDTMFNANCSVLDYGAAHGLFIGKSGTFDVNVGCPPGTEVGAIDRQIVATTFDLSAWIPGSLTDIRYDVFQEETLLSVTSVTVCTSSQGLVGGELWADQPLCDNFVDRYFLHHPAQIPFQNKIPYAFGPTWATTLISDGLFDIDLAASMAGSPDGNVAILLLPDFSNAIPDTDHYRALDAPGNTPPRLTFEGTLKECDVDADCAMPDACSTDVCEEFLCVDGPPVDCDDQNECTIDSCELPGGCEYEFEPADTPCEEVNLCDGAGNCLPPDQGTQCDEFEPWHVPHNWAVGESAAHEGNVYTCLVAGWCRNIAYEPGTSIGNAAWAFVEECEGDDGCEANPGTWQQGTYQSGDQVVGTDGDIYECKPWPFSGWCGAATAYRPSSGFAWEQAWDVVLECSN